MGPEKYRRTRKELTNESEKFPKSLKWPDTFIVEKYRTAKNLLNVSEKKRKELIIISKNLKWPDTFIVKSTVGLTKNLLMSPRMTGHFLLWKSTVGLRKMTRNFYCWKVPSDQKSTVGLAKNL